MKQEQQSIPATSAVAQSTTEGRVLPTALFGFRKSDVLATIDQLIKANAQQQQELEEQILTAKQELEGERRDKALLLKKTKELSDKLTGQDNRLREQAEKLQRAKQETEGVKGQLFNSEKENYTLRQEAEQLREEQGRQEEALQQAKHTEEQLAQAQQTAAETAAQLQQLKEENDGLRTELQALQVELDSWNARSDAAKQAALQVRQQAEQALQQAKEDAKQLTAAAQQDADKIRADANSAAVRLQEATRENIGRQQVTVRMDAKQIDDSLQALYDRLGGVEQQMKTAYQTLLGATRQVQQAVQQARHEADEISKTAHRMGEVPSGIPQQPSPEPEVQQKAAQPAAAAPGQQKQKPAAVAPPQAEAKGRSLSEMVLDRLARILG
ncbi:MAG: hypothetical protein PHG73_09810 [Pygmaiobacter sp.]|nr:hypothetical protein [Pygmaiobacter sp.]